MTSYLVTGASRGIGFAFIKLLSANPENIVVGLVRDKVTTIGKTNREIPGRKNLHIVQGDVTDVESLKRAVSETSEITGGRLDVLIANAGLISRFSGFDPISALVTDEAALEEDIMTLFRVNVVGNVHVFNLFLPLIKKGAVKKVVGISSGMSDLDAVVDYEFSDSAPYSISKVALNMVTAKYHAAYSGSGIIFMNVCPGTVDTGFHDNDTPEEQRKVAAMVQKFLEYQPNLTGMSKPEDAASDVLKVIEEATLEKNGGRIVSHFGNKQWL